MVMDHVPKPPALPHVPPAAPAPPSSRMVLCRPWTHLEDLKAVDVQDTHHFPLLARLHLRRQQGAGLCPGPVWGGSLGPHAGWGGWCLSLPGAHLDAGVDAVHQPVEEAAVDVLGQRIPAVVALGRGVKGLCQFLGGCWAPPLWQGPAPLTWGTLRVVRTISSRAFTVREHSACSRMLGSSPISSQISCSSAGALAAQR